MLIIIYYLFSNSKWGIFHGIAATRRRRSRSRSTRRGFPRTGAAGPSCSWRWRTSTTIRTEASRWSTWSPKAAARAQTATPQEHPRGESRSRSRSGQLFPRRL